MISNVAGLGFKGLLIIPASKRLNCVKEYHPNIEQGESSSKKSYYYNFDKEPMLEAHALNETRESSIPFAYIRTEDFRELEPEKAAKIVTAVEEADIYDHDHYF